MTEMITVRNLVKTFDGFRALDTEWWHFTLDDEPFPETYFTFPVRELAD